MKKKLPIGCLAVFGLALASCCIGSALFFRTDSTPPTLTASPARTDGTAVYLLIDVSGSMSEQVSNAMGGQEAKLAIARRAAVDVCNAVAKYAGERKDFPIQLAVASFSGGVTNIVPMGKPDAEQAERAINRLATGGDTAIGNATVMAQQALDGTRLRSQHILIVTDGQNTSGKSPEAVAAAINTLPEDLRPQVYVIAFDIAASVFDGVKKQGWQVYSAADGKELSQRLDEVVGGKILIER
jgi:hypothetical protein